jgi:hypothetical protein
MHLESERPRRHSFSFSPAREMAIVGTNSFLLACGCQMTRTALTAARQVSTIESRDQGGNGMDMSMERDGLDSLLKTECFGGGRGEGRVVGRFAI